jgi:hypothetical protein
LTCMSVSILPSARINLAPTGWIFMKFDVGDLLKSWESPNLVTTGQKYRALHLKTSVRLYFWQQYKIFCISTVWRECIVTFPWWHSTVLYCWQQNVAQEYKGKALLRFHGNSGYVNVPHCYVTRKLLVLFFVITWVNLNFLISMFFVLYVWATTFMHCGTDKEIGHICVKMVLVLVQNNFCSNWEVMQ